MGKIPIEKILRIISTFVKAVSAASATLPDASAEREADVEKQSQQEGAKGGKEAKAPFPFSHCRVH